jgi:molybdopterin converting factor small subunit
MHVEFLSVPRRLAGVSHVEVQAETLGQLLTTLAARFPSLGNFITLDRLHPSLLAENDHVLILSADAGG